MSETEKTRLEEWREEFAATPLFVVELEKAVAERDDDLVGPVRTKAGLVVCRAATRGEWQRYKSECHNEKKKADADEHLVRSCVLFPDKITFDKWLDVRPGIVGPIIKVVTELTGTDEVARGKA